MIGKCIAANPRIVRSAVSYYRVSTDKQGESGLGLDAQKSAVHIYASTNNLNILAEYTEVESGRNNQRPVLRQALHDCKTTQSILLIAKLDRLGRNVAFISKLMESDVDFVAVDNPHATKLILHVLAAFSEHERDQISRRTKEALKIAKSRGVILGKNAKELAKNNQARALVFARKMKPIINQFKDEGYETVRAIVDELNKRKIATVTGKGHWHVHTVFRLLNQIKNLK